MAVHAVAPTALVQPRRCRRRGADAAGRRGVVHSARGDGKENSAAIPQSPQHGKAEAKYNDTPTKKLTRCPSR